MNRKWDLNSDLVQAYLLTYDQIRQAEDQEFQVQIAAASAGAKVSL